MLGNFFQSSKRIFIVSKKPNSQEFLQMSKITGIGIVLIGIIGFIVYFLFTFFGIGH
ncbi:protein translocase SEC61 complex subunit gamma [Candidatus Micrarchaeota archaeon]|nr:protein translocase SEC61 complex subunit gamma [Candidatus Micrarchaeota archaeon]MBU1930028.1 protein translocase SEC61 complex subunit gamma [Candidatus Micrarchaeota archaeon]